MEDDDVRELRHSLKLLQRRLRRETFGVSLSRTALQVLGACIRLGETAPGLLGAELSMTTPNVAAALRELEQARLLRRRPDPDDGRRTRVLLTAEGVEVGERVRAERDGWLGRAIDARLDAEEQRILVQAARLLRRVADHEDDATAVVPDGPTPASPRHDGRGDSR